MSTGVSEAARAPISCRDRPYQERPADIARRQMRVGIPESMKSQHVRQYAPKVRITYLESPSRWLAVAA